MGTNSSYIWKSIIWGRELIARGLMWREGDGWSISAFKDAWIPGIFLGKSLVNYNSSIDVKVAEFIRQNGTWNEEELRNLFPTFEEEILNIPINPSGDNDTRYWKWEKKSNYSVKSGY